MHLSDFLLLSACVAAVGSSALLWVKAVRRIRADEQRVVRLRPPATRSAKAA